VAVGLDVALFTRFTEDPSRILAGHANTSAALVITLALLAVPLLALRRYAPVAVCVAVSAHALVSTAAVGSRPLLGLLLALHSAAAWRPLRAAFGCLAAVLVAHGAAVYYEVASLAPDARMLDAILVGTVFVLLDAAAFGVGRWQAAAHERARGLLASRDLAAAEAVANERLRIARELHDIVAHSLTLMVLQSAGANALMTTRPDQARQALRVVDEAGQQALAEMGRLLQVMRSAGDEASDPEGGYSPRLSALTALADRARSSGIATVVEQEGTPVRLDDSVDLCAYRVVQEALTNVIRHAGPGASAHVLLRWHDASLTILVTDDGSGVQGPSSLPTSGLGLIGLRERVKIAGGTIDVSPAPQGGFRVAVWLPSAAAHASPGAGETPGAGCCGQAAGDDARPPPTPALKLGAARPQG